MDWREFWNGNHAIYVNDRHRRLHADLVARGVLAHVGRDARLLDWGCGEALAAEAVAAGCRRLYLYDAAPRVLDGLRARYGRDPRIVVLDEAGLRNLAEGSLDLIAIVSVIQYVSRDDLGAVLDALRPKLTLGGRLILGDVIPPGLSPMADAAALLAFGLRSGFLSAAFVGLARTLFGDYRRLRGQLGLTTWNEEELIAFLRTHGFSATRARANIGHNQARTTFVAERADQSMFRKS